MKKIEQFISIAMLVFAIGFNLWIYRMEPTAKVDPNDNTFQFALVYRTNQMWDYATKKCSGNILTFPVCHFSYLADHWVPNWNEGYNLPFYYSHIPQILIVGSWRFFHWIIGLLDYWIIGLFQWYHWIIYLLLCLFPLSVFLALLITGLSPITAGFGALLASQISTDGFYGLDPASFLWRGYGLSSQLFAMIFLPLAIAFIYRKKVIPAVIFLVLTTAGHLGIGIMAFLSMIPLLFRHPKKLVAIALPAIFILSYWIVPALLNDKFHNFSFWDPVWKFNSYGAKEVITRLFNGALFDFGRLPIFTGLVFIGLFAIHDSSFTILFIFFLLLYFGRTTWGNVLDIIPGMKEFHLSRFIVGVHLAGMFLAPIGLTWALETATTAVSRFVRFPIKFIKFIIFIIVIVFVFPAIYGQTIRYAAYNDTLIFQANGNYAKQSAGADTLVSTLQELEKTAPGRVFAGRAGWGGDFRIAETPMNMYLSNFAIPTVLWMPETWSPNADTEQYFREDKAEDYALYNIRYVATPARNASHSDAGGPARNASHSDAGGPAIQPFWRHIKSNPSWNIYEVQTSGYFTAGVRPAVVASDKYSRTNVIRLWIQSSDPKNGLYPELSFDTKKYPVNVGLPNFKMLDEVTYQVQDGTIHNLFSEPPKYMSPISPRSLTRLPAPASPPAKPGEAARERSDGGQVTLSSQTNDSDMVFSTRASVPEGCTECMVILKQTYHPNWRVTVDGEPAESIITFPFFIGIPVTAGSHEIVASYEPSRLKIILLVLTLTVCMVFVLRRLRRAL